MTRSRNHKSSEDYLGLIRQLKSENRQLKKRIKQLEKQFYTKIEKIEEENPKLELCPSCGKGTLDCVVVAGRTFTRCDTCEYRTKAAYI